MKVKFLLILTLTLLFSCGKEQFSINTLTDQGTVPETNTINNYKCTKYTLVRPEVDLLFLWDNSSSQFNTKAEIKTALNNVINNISNRFDYNVLMAPLIGTGNSNTYFFSYSGHTPGSGITKIDKSNAANVLGNFPTGGATEEAGVQRAVDLLQNNQSNGVFRDGAYTIVVVMSNEDDNSYNQSKNFETPQFKDPYIKAKTQDLLCLRGNYSPDSTKYSSSFSTFGSNCSGANRLNSPMMRFISITALGSSSSCQATVGSHNKGIVYKSVSNSIYTTSYTNDITAPTDQNSRVFYSGEANDAYDICRGNYQHIFDGVNNAIQDTVLKHKYQYWPVADSSTSIDKATINLQTNTGKQFYPIDDDLTISTDSNGNDTDQYGNPVNGFRYFNTNQTVNTRFYPSEGESYTGKVIELYGDAKEVVWPECFMVSAKAPKTYYGYISMNSKPVESTIKVTINGVSIPQSSTNGWQLVKTNGEAAYIEHQNIKVKGASDNSEAIPGIFETGYFVKLYGSAIYTDGATKSVNYEPAGQ